MVVSVHDDQRRRLSCEPPDHGGDPHDAGTLYGVTHDNWLDLSTGISPWSYPIPEIALSGWRELPSQRDLAALEACAARYYGVADASNCLAIAGSQSAIEWLPRIITERWAEQWGVEDRPPLRCAILSPTYSEHAASWLAAAISPQPILQLHEASGFDVLVIVHPNNPDGRTFPRQKLVDLAAHQAQCGGYLILDEAFCDLTPELSLAALAGQPGLIILRSVGKFFGLAGLRLGFVLAPAEICHNLAQIRGLWPLSGPALRIGRAAFSDHGWIIAHRQRVNVAARQLDALLAAHGLQVIGGTGLFRLLDLGAAAEDLHRGLAHQGIWTRKFAAHPSWLRIGLPGSEAELTRLGAALSAALVGAPAQC